MSRGCGCCRYETCCHHVEAGVWDVLISLCKNRPAVSMLMRQECVSYHLQYISKCRMQTECSFSNLEEKGKNPPPCWDLFKWTNLRVWYFPAHGDCCDLPRCSLWQALPAFPTRDSLPYEAAMDRADSVWRSGEKLLLYRGTTAVWWDGYVTFKGGTNILYMGEISCRVSLLFFFLLLPCSCFLNII